MSNRNKQTALPKVRFPTFQDMPPWEYKKLHEIGTKVVCKNQGNKVTRVLTNSANEGVVDQRDYFQKDIANKNNLEGYSIVKMGDYVYNPRISKSAPVGPISKNKVGKGVMSPLYTIFRFLDEKSDFYEHYFKSTRWHGYMHSVSNSGARHDRINITSKAFMDLPLPCPDQKEQQKIADCLVSLEAAIISEGCKLKALQRHKTGLAHLLFPVEGEACPRVRFPVFCNSPSWEEKEIGAYIEEFREKSISQDQFEVFTSARMGLVRQRDYYDNDSITERSNIGFNIIPPGYITYRSRSDDNRFFFNENNLGENGIISIYYPVFTIKGGINRFFIELFARYSALIGKHSVGNAQTVLSMSVLKKIKLPIPSYAEQKLISDCLFSIDEKIVRQAKKVELLSDLKKGLMQQLFPSVEEREA